MRTLGDLIDHYRAERKEKIIKAKIIGNPLRDYQVAMVNEIINVFIESDMSTINRNILWFYDPVGNKGKSQVNAWFQAMLGDHVQVIADVSVSIKDIMLTTHKNPQKCFCFVDITRGKLANFNYDILEIASSQQFTKGKYKSETNLFKESQMCVVFANAPPKIYIDETSTTLSKDRFRIYELVKEGGRMKLFDNNTPCSLEQETLWYSDMKTHTWSILDSFTERKLKRYIRGSGKLERRLNPGGRGDLC